MAAPYPGSLRRGATRARRTVCGIDGKAGCYLFGGAARLVIVFVTGTQLQGLY
jgi:hypothetical protein